MYFLYLPQVKKVKKVFSTFPDVAELVMISKLNVVTS